MRTYLGLALLASFAASIPFVLQGCSSDDDDDAKGSDAGAVDGSIVAPHDSGTTDGGDGGDGGLSAAQACSDSAHARCTALDSCSNSVETTARWGSSAECETRLAAQCLLNLAGTGTAANPTTTESCAQTVPTESCSTLLSNTDPPQCVPPMGAGASGSPCFAAGQCQSSYCAVAATAGCGTCASVPQPGDMCAVTGDCGDRLGLTCANGQCVAYLDAGAACQAGAPCMAGYGCTTPAADSGADGGGSCELLGTTVGATCNGDSVGAPACNGNSGLACVRGLCATAGYAGGGAPCGNDLDGGVVRCAASGTCVTVDSGVANVKNGSCLAAAADNAACDTVSGPACLPQARCVVSDGGTGGTCLSLSNATCP